jgi:peptidoglycan hydrolase-like protein with peptidoglycan-binding domain
LIKIGYNPGHADGLMGIKTSEAIRQFQLDNNISATGDLDSEMILPQ